MGGISIISTGISTVAVRINVIRSMDYVYDRNGFPEKIGRKSWVSTPTGGNKLKGQCCRSQSKLWQTTGYHKIGIDNGSNQKQFWDKWQKPRRKSESHNSKMQTSNYSTISHRKTKTTIINNHDTIEMENQHFNHRCSISSFLDFHTFHLSVTIREITDKHLNDYTGLHARQKYQQRQQRHNKTRNSNKTQCYKPESLGRATSFTLPPKD